MRLIQGEGGPEDHTITVQLVAQGRQTYLNSEKGCVVRMKFNTLCIKTTKMDFCIITKLF